MFLKTIVHLFYKTSLNLNSVKRRHGSLWVCPMFPFDGIQILKLEQEYHGRDAAFFSLHPIRWSTVPIRPNFPRGFTLITWLWWCLPDFSAIKLQFCSLQLIRMMSGYSWVYVNVPFFFFVRLLLFMLKWTHEFLLSKGLQMCSFIYFEGQNFPFRPGDTFQASFPVLLTRLLNSSGGVLLFIIRCTSLAPALEKAFLQRAWFCTVENDIKRPGPKC